MKSKLALFDIDGILIIGKNKVHRESFSAAIKKVFGLDTDIDEIQTSGKTDTGIIFELLERKGIRAEQARPKLK